MSGMFDFISNASSSSSTMVETTVNEKSREHADKILAKYPDRVPVLVVMKEKRVQLEKCKYLVPLDITIGQLVYVIRKNVKNLKESEAIFFFIHEKKVLPPTSALVSTIYNSYNKDGFLQLDVGLENTFG